MPRGDFSTLTMSPDVKEMLSSAYTAISSVEGGWEFLATYSPPDGEGFVFVRYPPVKMKEIESAITDMYPGHSGSSYGYTMRQMESLAKNGWENWSSPKNDEQSLLKARIAILEAEKAQLCSQLAEFTASKKEMTRDEKIRAALAKGCTTTGHPCAGCLARKDILVEEWHEQQEKEKEKEKDNESSLMSNEDTLSNLMKGATAVDTFLASILPDTNITKFANAIQNDAGMRAQIPDIDNQADAIRRFADGKISYAEMRSLCG